MRVATGTPESLQTAVDGLFAAMGEPARSPLQTRAGDDFPDARIDETQVFHPHPVFALAVHALGNDDYQAQAYSSQNPHRGDLLSVPCITEDSRVVLLETSFHKGHVYVELVEFPHCHDAVEKALITLLRSVATR